MDIKGVEQEIRVELKSISSAIKRGCSLRQKTRMSNKIYPYSVIFLRKHTLVNNLKTVIRKY